MIKPFYVLTLHFLFFIQTTAQVKTASVSIAKGSRITDIKRIKNTGFVVQTHDLRGIGISGKERSLIYFNSDLHLNWNIRPLHNDQVITSPESPYIYQLGSRPAYYERRVIADVQYPEERSARITRTDSYGKQDSFYVNFRETDKKVIPLASCIDSRNLYHLSYLPEESHVKKGFFSDKVVRAVTPVALFLRVMAHHEKDFKEKTVYLIFREQGELNFLGCSNGLIYIYQKFLKNPQEMEFDIYAIDQDGNVKSQFSIEHKVTDFYAPLNFNRELHGTTPTVKNFQIISSQQTNDLTYYPILNSISDLQIDFKSGRIFLYGLCNQQKSTYDSEGGRPISNFYLNIYTLDGKLLSNSYHDITNAIKDNKTFRGHLNSYYRCVDFELLSDSLYRLNLGSRQSSFTSILLNSSNILSYHTNDNTYDFYGELAIFDFPAEFTYKANLSASEMESSNSYQQYIASNPVKQSKKTRYLAVNMEKQYVLIKYEKKKKDILLTFMLFK